MQLSKFIAVKNKVEINKPGKEKIESYRTMIQEVNENTFAIDIPTKRRRPWVPAKGELIELGVITDNARYIFESRVVNRIEKPLPLIFLEIPQLEKVRRVQLREFFRVDLIIDVSYKALEPEEAKDYRNLELESRGTVLDLSGGGLRMVINTPLEIDSKVAVEFQLEERNFKLLGQVRRCQEQLLPEKKLFIIGISFEDITIAEQDFIISYCFKRQLESSK